ncbi:hypothetical protein FN846DRAFT_890148 [Sphaerosporella brunnea]|uniref:Zn(2)-C6 fungal-type domain-containing protein n=1 Tax=Sphaerosporella brunnea TaxID=1250544 RepID=A0A5J5EX21_9PEZI|nr:hypothetical protein FN846DRAFT_890148 [Sphaerosporella brunnea]
MHPKNTKDSNTGKEPPRKRVARACDRCRLKKGKCDGKEQCAKCVSADVMCIYTDRKPPQHKLISPAVAEALQSENLTLKKATIILFKQLMVAQGGKLPAIEGVDWNSEKVANGKSGRALNYIISQQAKVDNRISNEEITSYDSDTQMLDSSRTCPNSPGSRQSSPQSTAGELWNSGYEITQQQQPPEPDHKKRNTQNTKFGYPGMPATGVTGDIIPATSAPFIDPGLLQPTGAIGSAFNHPPTPPTGCDALDLMPAGPIQWTNHQQQQQPQPRFYDQRFIVMQTQGYLEEVQPQQEARGSGGIACDNSWVTPAAFYQYLGEDKDYGKVYDSMGSDVHMYDRM